MEERNSSLGEITRKEISAYVIADVLIELTDPRWTNPFRRH